MKSAVFFDKDGILNEVVMRGDDLSSPRVLEEFRLMPGAQDVVAAAREAGFVCILATNQPDVELGRMTEDTLREILARVKALGLDDLEVCLDGTLSDRRAKPNPGMLLDAAARHNVDLNRSFMVGDTDRDVIAGRAAGARTILLRTNYNKAVHGTADWDFDSLYDIAEFFRSSAKVLAFEEGES
jgi:D-glycero-D-manno-heptose 1,7-bisphosphate phosphatase